MAKYTERLEARRLRKNGESLTVIANLLNVSKSSVSLWCRDIVLSEKKLVELKKRKLSGAEKGRILAAKIKRSITRRKKKRSLAQGLKEIGSLSKRELMLVGTALYWAEGSKKDNRIRFCNSDVRMILIFIHWLEKCYGISKSQLCCNVGINQIYKKRELEVKKYWAELTGLALSQFRKTSFVKSKNKKIYDNISKHYGTLYVELLKPGEKRYKIYGLVDALANVAG